MKRFAMQLLCLVVTAMPVYAAGPVTTQPMVSLCPVASELQAQAVNVAPRCVACTVGLVSLGGTADMQSIESGSGVIVSADGLIMTAGHVIEKPGNPLTIRFSDGRVVQGLAVGLDHATDTGLAKITDPAPAGGWPVATVAPDDSLNIGDWVLATGNPGSIVLDRNPPLRLGRVTGHNSRNLETNCALEPGDSGGPVFDLQGRVVGINSRIRTTEAGDVAPKEYQSTHVPVGMFTAQWKDLLGGINANPDVRLGRGAPRPRGGVAKAALLRRAITKLMAQKDPEVLKLMRDAQGPPGSLRMTPELMDHLIEKATFPPRPVLRPRPRQREQLPRQQPFPAPGRSQHPTRLQPLYRIIPAW